MTYMQYFDDISFHISPNNKKLDISKIYAKWAVEKCSIWNFQTPIKLRNSKNKSVQIISGHPVSKHPLSSCQLVVLPVFWWAGVCWMGKRLNQSNWVGVELALSLAKMLHLFKEVYKDWRDDVLVVATLHKFGIEGQFTYLITWKSNL